MNGFLIIDEGGTVFHADEITDSELEAADAGILSVVSVRHMTEYIDGVWHELARWDMAGNTEGES